MTSLNPHYDVTNPAPPHYDVTKPPMTSLPRARSVVQSFALEHPSWTCCWNQQNPVYFFCGLTNNRYVVRIPPPSPPCSVAVSLWLHFSFSFHHPHPPFPFPSLSPSPPSLLPLFLSFSLSFSLSLSLYISSIVLKSNVRNSRQLPYTNIPIPLYPGHTRTT